MPEGDFSDDYDSEEDVSAFSLKSKRNYRIRRARYFLALSRSPELISKYVHYIKRALAAIGAKELILPGDVISSWSKAYDKADTSQKKRIAYIRFARLYKRMDKIIYPAYYDGELNIIPESSYVTYLDEYYAGISELELPIIDSIKGVGTGTSGDTSAPAPGGSGSSEVIIKSGVNHPVALSLGAGAAGYAGGKAAQLAFKAGRNIPLDSLDRVRRFGAGARNAAVRASNAPKPMPNLSRTVPRVPRKGSTTSQTPLLNRRSSNVSTKSNFIASKAKPLRRVLPPSAKVALVAVKGVARRVRRRAARAGGAQ
jgi:hypothetical protein